jgi:hypothetical protein
MQLQVRKDNRRIDAYGDFPAGLSAEAAAIYDLMTARPQDEDAIRNQPGSKVVVLDGQGRIANLVVTAPDPQLVYFQQSQFTPARVRTPDATLTEIIRIPLAPLSGYAATLQLIAVDAGNGVIWRYHADVTCKRLSAGAIVEGIDTITNRRTGGAPAATSNVAAWTATAVASGNDVVISVQGAAGRSVDWYLSGLVIQFTPAGT